MKIVLITSIIASPIVLLNLGLSFIMINDYMNNKYISIIKSKTIVF